jgi:hypothetical protein
MREHLAKYGCETTNEFSMKHAAKSGVARFSSN